MVWKQKLRHYGAPALAAIALALPACAAADNNPTIAEDPVVEISEVIESPSDVIYQEVSVNGAVDSIITPTAFALAENADSGADVEAREPENSLLILDAAATEAVEAGQLVRVIGEVRPFDVAELEDEYNLTWEDGLKRELSDTYKDKPAIVAKSVMIVD